MKTKTKVKAKIGANKIGGTKPAKKDIIATPKAVKKLKLKSAKLGKPNKPVVVSSTKIVKKMKSGKPIKTTKAAKVVKAVKAAKPAKVSKKAAKPAKGLSFKEPMNKTQLIAHYMEALEWERSDVVAFMNEQDRVIAGSIGPRAGGIFVLPGLMKVVTVKVAAKKMPKIKKGTPVRNPSTGEMMPSKGRDAFTKPATIRVKVRVLAKLKAAAIGA